MSTRLIHVTTADDVVIAVHRIGDPSGARVILAPGTFSNASFWLGTRGTGFARELAAQGFDAWVIEFRGHGLSQRPDRDQRWNFDDWGRLDLAAIIRHAAQDGRRAALVGHSAGGASVLAALAGEPDLEPLVTAAAIVATPLPWLQRWRRAAAWAMRAASARMRSFPARLLRLGPEDELAGVMEQWMDWNLEGHWTGRDGTDYVQAIGRLRLPLHFLAGSGDHVFAPPDACRGLHDLAASAARVFIEAGTDTGFRCDYDHVGLIVSREARSEIWPLLADWLRSQVDSPDPGHG